MKPIEVSNILKVVDIHQSQISISTWGYLNKFFVTYRDEKLREHLIDVNEAKENTSIKRSSLIKKEINKLFKLAQKYNAGYVRFIN